MHTPSGGARCGYPFEEGREYLVYAFGNGEHFKVDLCSKGKLLSKAGANLAVLGDGEKAADDETLSDTSVGAMVGLAEPAMTASFALVVRLARTG